MNRLKYPPAYVMITIVAVSLGVMSSKSPVHAQQLSEGIAYLLSVPDQEAIDASLICSKNEQEISFILCDSEYQGSMYGVISASPSASIEPKGVSDGKFIVSQGKTRVRASDIGGEIRMGDYLTSSEIPGVAKKAEKNGYVLGVALEPLTNKDESGVGIVNTALSIHFESNVSNARTNLIEVLRGGITLPLFEPLSTFRYILAALLILVSFTLGFLYFGRISNSGVEAIGRNPLASKAIRVQIFINIIISVVIVIVGLFAAYLILIL